MSESDKNKILQDLGEHISSELGEAVVGFEISFDELNVTLVRENLIEAMRFLRDDSKTNFISFVDLWAALIFLNAKSVSMSSII